MRTSSSLRSSAGTLRRIPQALSTVTTIEYSISVLQLLVSYNTASGKRCCNLYWVLLSVSLISGYNTASGKRCCNPSVFYLFSRGGIIVTIPQAVSAVATSWNSNWKVLAPRYNTASGKRCCNSVRIRVALRKWVTIPQAVSAVATKENGRRCSLSSSYNTASGKRCCNKLPPAPNAILVKVTIPQAVSAVATAGSRKPVFMRFQKVVLENLKP